MKPETLQVAESLVAPRPLPAVLTDATATKWLARQVSMTLDPTVSAGWTATASMAALVAYIERGVVPAGTRAPVAASGKAPLVGAASYSAHAAVLSDEDLDALEVRMREIATEEVGKVGGSAPASSDLEAVKARIDIVEGSVLEAVDTARAVADEAAAKAAAAAEAAAKAIAGAAASAAGVSEADLKRLIEEVVSAESAKAKPVAPVAPAPPSHRPKAKPAASKSEASPSSSPSEIPDSGDSAPSAGEDAVLDHLSLFCSPGAATKPVIVKGEAGAGKTYAARIHGRLFDAAYEIALNAQTEASDLLGFPRVDGGWQDGPLTAAFRSAAAGYTTQLRLDEFYRPSNQARSVLLTCTSPFEDAEGREFYVLTTGRATPHPTEEGVYQQEVLYAPCHLLAIVATTNVGAAYDVSAGDPAEKRRFAPVHVDVDEAVIRRVLGATFPKAHSCLRASEGRITDSFVAFWHQCKVLAKSSMIEVAPTVSTFAEAVKHPNSVCAASLQRVLLALGLHVWCGEDPISGEPIAEQLSAVKRTLAMTFSK